MTSTLQGKSETGSPLRKAVGACLALTVASAFAEIDITAHLRELSQSGSEWYSVDPYGDTIPYSTTPVSGAVDGISGANGATMSGRALFQKKIKVSDKDVVNPCDVRYAILPVDGKQLSALVTSFTLRRFQTGNDYDDLRRTPSRFSLLGSNDGQTWNVLYAADGVVWSAETVVRTFEIPLSKRCPYVQYRFKLDASTVADNYAGYHELVLNGSVSESLSWVGAAGGRWNLVDANWQGGDAVPRTWLSGAQATFGGTGPIAVEVEGDVAVGTLHVRPSGACLLSEGCLKMLQPFARLAIESPMTMASAIADCEGQATAAQAEYLPTDNSWVKLWTNRDLSRLAFSGAYFHSGTYGDGPATICHQRMSDGVVSVQFQNMHSASSPLLCVKAEFKQVGNDVFARGVYARYTWADGREIGVDFDGIRDESKLTSWNVKDIVAAETGAPSAPLAFGLHADGVPDCRANAFLPQSGSSAGTGEAVLSWTNRRVEDILDVHSFEFYDGATRNSNATACYFSRTEHAVTFQVQCNRSENPNSENARLCVKVELTQVGDDVYARAVYAKYHWFAVGVVPSSLDFDDEKGVSTIHDETHAGGYGVRALKLNFRTRLCLTGTCDTARDWEIEEGTLRLGASEVSFASRACGTGTLAFAPVSGLQSVSYSGVCDCGLALGNGTTLTLPENAVKSVPRALFEGESTVVFSDGSSLSCGEVAFGEGAVVNLVIPKGAEARSLRVGTSATLSPEDLRHFKVNGRPVRRQTANGWLDTSVPGLVLLFK